MMRCASIVRVKTPIFSILRSFAADTRFFLVAEDEREKEEKY